MNEKIEFINGIMQRYDVYSHAIKWNKTLEKDDSIEWMMGSMIAGYKDDELMMINIINNYYYETDKKSIIISVSKNPKLKDEEFELRVLSFVLNFSKYELGAKRVYVELMPSNKDGIKYLNANNFDIHKSDEKKLIYKKELTSKEGD